MSGTSSPIGGADRLAADYDPVAGAYAEHFSDELRNKPFDITMLDWLAARVGELGPICDLGCGPGQVAAYLHDRGAAVCGIDPSAAMVGEARTRNPGIGFAQGDMLELAGVADESFGGIAAFYAIVNIAPAQLGTVFSEMARVLRPGGTVILSFHIGNEVRRLDELLGVAVALDFSFIETAEVTTRLWKVGLEVTEAIEREPYPDHVEHQSRRAYIFARKPDAPDESDAPDRRVPIES